MLNHSQVRIALLQLYHKNKPLYNMSFNIKIDGLINIDLLEKSINYILIRYKTLKTNIYLENEMLKYRYSKKKINIEMCDHNDKIKINETIQNFENYIFDLENDLLIKVLYINECNKLLFLFSDIIIDGYTVVTFFKDLGIIYSSLFINKIPKLDSISNFKSILKPEDLENKLDFWKSILNNKIKSKTYINKISYSNNYHEGRIRFKIEKKEFLRIQNYIKKNQVTLFDYITSLFLLLLHIVENEKEILIDTIIGNFDKNIIGLLNDTVIIPNIFDLVDRIDFIDYVSNISNKLNKIKENKLSLEYISSKLDLLSLPNIRLHFEYSNKNTEKEINYGNAKIMSDLYENSNNYIRQLLILNVCEYNEYLECYISFRKELFETDYIENLKFLFQKLINISLDKNELEFCELKKSKLVQDIYNNNKFKYEPCIDERLIAYKMAGNYPDIKFNNFCKKLDNINN